MSSQNKTKVGLLACAKDEGPWLLEWIAHHQCLGFDEIAIATNDCSDGTDKMCDILQELGTITHIDNPEPYDEITKSLYGKYSEPSIQTAAYARLQKLPNIQDCEWVITVDLDEFLVLHHGDGTVHELVAKYPKADGIMINWRLFGDSGKTGMLDGCITDQLTKCSEVDFPRNIMFRSLVRNHDRMLLNAHIPFKKQKNILKNRYARAVERARRQREFLNVVYNGKIYKTPQSTTVAKFVESFTTLPNSYSDGQVNHYAVKTNEICRLKATRGNVDGNSIHWAYEEKYHFLFNRNEAEDFAIFKYQKKRNHNLKHLLKNKDLHHLHSIAQKNTAEQLEPFEYKTEIFKRMKYPSKVSNAEMAKANSKSIPTIYVVAPFGSGSSAVTGYLALSGAYYCPPVAILNDETTEITFEPMSLAYKIRAYISEATFRERRDMEEFRSYFADWHKRQTVLAKRENADAIIIKHGLLPLVLPYIHDLTDSKYLIVERPFAKIERTRRRRKWGKLFGSKGARILYERSERYLKKIDAEYTTVKFEDFLKDHTLRENLVEAYGIHAKPDDLKFAESWLRTE